MLTTVRTANRAVRFAHKLNRAQPPQFGSPHEPHRDATVRFMGGRKPPWFAAVRHGSPNRRSTPWFFSVRDIFSRAFATLAQQVGFPSSSAYTQIVFADSRVAAALHLALLSRARHLQKDHIFTPSLYSPSLAHADPPPHSRVRSYFSSLRSFSVFDGRIFGAFAHSQHSTVAFWQLLLNCSIR